MTQPEKELVSFQIETVREYMLSDDFQRDFFESLADQWEKKEFLSVKQCACLMRIYERVTK